MGRKSLLPNDIRQECLWIVRGYERRVKAYHEARRNVIDGTAQQFLDMRGKNGKEGQRVYLPHGSGTGRPNENKFDQLAAIEKWPETKKIRAVENARLHIGLDLESKELRKKLADGIVLNCQSRKQYPYARMNLPGISERTFKRRKAEFLYDIAEYLEML